MELNAQTDNASTSSPSTASNERALVAVNDRWNQLPALQWPHAAGGLPTRPVILSARPTPVDLLHALRRRWVSAVGFGLLLAGIVAGLMWWLVPIRYEAEGFLFVNKATPGVMEKAPGNSDEFLTFCNTQKQYLKNSYVLTRAKNSPEMAKLLTLQEHKDDPVGYLAENLEVDFPGNGELMRVAFRGKHRGDVALIVNAIIDSYMNEVVDVERKRNLEERDDLEKTYASHRDNQRQKGKAFQEAAKDANAASSDEALVKRKIALQKLDSLLYACSNLRDDLRELEINCMLKKRHQEQKGEASSVPEHWIETALSQDPQIQEDTKQANRLRRAIAQAKKLTAKPDHGSVVGYEMALAELEATIEEEREALRPRIEAQFASLPKGDDIPEELRQPLELLEAKRDEIASALEAKEKELEAHTDDVKKLDASNLDLEAREADLKKLNSIIERMGDRLSVLKVELGAKPRIRPIQPATPPQSSDAMRKYLGLGFASLLSFGLAVFGIAYLEFHSRRVNGSGEIREGLGLPVLGELPPLSGRAWRKLQSGKGGGSSLQAVLNESVDSVRAKLIHTSLAESPRVVMITSSESGEGKSTVATQLAASLARSGRRTLLVDGDVRNPSAQRVFELPLEPGLCDVLRGTVPREGAIQPSSSTNLWVLTAGRCCVRSVQALSQAMIRDLFTALRTEFDFVIIDSGPVLQISDPLLLGQNIDAAVISVLRDVSQTPRVYEAIDQLQSVGIKILGVVVNGVTDRSRKYQYELALPSDEVTTS